MEATLEKKSSNALFSVNGAQGIGLIEMRLFDIEKDLELLHFWMNEEHVIPFWQMNKSKAELHQHFTQMLADKHQELLIVSLDGRDILYVEVYTCKGDRIEGKYEMQQQDWGYHALIGELDVVGKGFGLPLGRAIMEYMFEEKGAQRIISEPDERAVASEKIDLKLGFEFHHFITFPEKRAKLFILEKHSFYDLFPA